MTHDELDLVAALERFRADLLSSTVAKWRHGPAAFMDQPRHVLVRPRSAKLSMVVAVASEPGFALTIGRLRDFAPLFASFLHTATHDGAPRNEWRGDEILRLWAASWQRLSSRWAWAGWNPQTHVPETPDSAMGRNESWEVAPGHGAVAVVTAGSRELVVPRDTVPKTPDDRWILSDDGTGLRRRVRDGRGTTVADFSREEDARFVVAARTLMPILGGAAQALLEQASSRTERSWSLAEIRGVLDSAPPWQGANTPPPTALEGRR